LEAKVEREERIRTQLKSLFDGRSINVNGCRKTVSIGCTQLKDEDLVKLAIRTKLLPASEYVCQDKRLRLVNERMKEYVERFCWDEELLDFIGQYIVTTEKTHREMSSVTDVTEDVYYAAETNYFFPVSCVDEVEVPEMEKMSIIIYHSPVLVKDGFLRHGECEKPIPIDLLKDILIFKGILPEDTEEAPKEN
jgi:hypothetical protein